MQPVKEQSPSGDDVFFLECFIITSKVAEKFQKKYAGKSSDIISMSTIR